jgi:hypothetical protein
MHDEFLRGALSTVAATMMMVLGGCGNASTANLPPQDAAASFNDDRATPADQTGATAEAGDAGAVAEGGDESATGDAGNGGAACPGVAIVPDSNGLVAMGSNPLGIAGSWYAYYDCSDYMYFNAGTPMPGVNCSNVTAPSPLSPFTPTSAPQAAGGAPTKMCTSGTTVAASNFQLQWGAGIGLDLNNPGGTKMDFNAIDAGAVPLKGFCFVLSGARIPEIRVDLPSDQGITDNWYFEAVIKAGVYSILFTDTALRQRNPTSTAFDPGKLMSIQFEIPASATAPIPWDFCIDELTAIQ